MIDSAALGEWVRGLSPEEAARALVALGVETRTRAYEHTRPRSDRHPPLLGWTLTAEQFKHRLSAVPRTTAGLLAGDDPVRLAVTTDALPSDLLPRLLGAAAVASAFVALQRAPGSLRRRPWRWPLRIGLLGPDAAQRARELRDEMGRDGRLPLRLIDVRAVDYDPGAVDVLVVEAPLADATAAITRGNPAANAVLVLARPVDRWPVASAQLATIRATTAAVASALLTPSSVAELLTSLIYEIAHAHPFDVALTRAARDEVILCAEPDAMRIAALPETTRRVVRDLRRFTAALPAAAGTSSGVIEEAAAGEFRNVSHEALTIAVANEELSRAMDAAVTERWLQARLADATPGAVAAAGINAVAVFLGPLEAGAAPAAAPMDESSLPWQEQAADAFRLTVVLVPFAPRGTVQQHELLLPRLGRSTDVRFELDVTAGNRASGRLVVLFRNRILQTAVLTVADGEPLRLDDAAAISPSLTRLDDRRVFDVALMAHQTEAARSLVAHAGTRTTVSDMPSLPPIAARIADTLAKAVRLRAPKRGLRSPGARALLVELAQHGSDLHSELERELAPLEGADRIQVVTAHGQWFLPIESAYTRYAPDDDAAICPRYLDDPGTCDGACTPVTDRSTVCPNAFWGLSKTIERHHYDPTIDGASPNGNLLISLDPPARGTRDLVVRRVLLGTSERVKAADRDATLSALGDGAIAAASWAAWAAALKEADTELLVLLPHTDYKQVSLEISADGLQRSHIEPEYVTGARDVHPVVVLFGCRTTGKADDPAGFATRFMTKGARAVFHSSTDLLNVHAATLAQRLVGHLTKPDREPQLLSDAQAAFRREAVHDGYLAAFAIAAFGDADWRL